MKFPRIIEYWIDEDRQELQDKLDDVYGKGNRYVEQSSDRSVFYDVYDRQGNKIHSGLFAKIMADLNKIIFRRRQ